MTDATVTLSLKTFDSIRMELEEIRSERMKLKQFAYHNLGFKDGDKRYEEYRNAKNERCLRDLPDEKLWVEIEALEKAGKLNIKFT